MCSGSSGATSGGHAGSAGLLSPRRGLAIVDGDATDGFELQLWLPLRRLLLVQTSWLLQARGACRDGFVVCTRAAGAAAATMKLFDWIVVLRRVLSALCYGAGDPSPGLPRLDFSGGHACVSMKATGTKRYAILCR